MSTCPAHLLHLFACLRILLSRLPAALVLFMLEYGLRFQDIVYLPSKVRTGKYKAAETMPSELNSYVMKANNQDVLLWQHANTLLDQRKQDLQQRCGEDIVATAMATFIALQGEVARQCSNFTAWYAENKLPAQYTYVNDEGWGWRCVRHVARLYMEGNTGALHDAAAVIQEV